MTKWDRRDRKNRKRMPVAGRNIGVVYANAIAKKAKRVR